MFRLQVTWLNNVAWLQKNNPISCPKCVKYGRKRPFYSEISTTKCLMTGQFRIILSHQSFHNKNNFCINNCLWAKKIDVNRDIYVGLASLFIEGW